MEQKFSNFFYCGSMVAVLFATEEDSGSNLLIENFCFHFSGGQLSPWALIALMEGYCFQLLQDET